MIFLASQERCNTLPPISDGRDTVLYIPPSNVFIAYLPTDEHYVGTIATYKCSPGYQLVGGSVRACIPGGMWYGTEPTCGMLNCIAFYVTYSLCQWYFYQLCVLLIFVQFII